MTIILMYYIYYTSLCCDFVLRPDLQTRNMYLVLSAFISSTIT